MACDARKTDTRLAVVRVAAGPAAPRTLESTLRLPDAVDEIQFYPEIAGNARGDVIAVWEQFDGEHYRIWANSRAAGQGWGKAIPIEKNPSGHAYNPQVALNAHGSAIAVWVQADDAAGTRTVWSSRLETATGWKKATPVDRLAAAAAYSPHVAIDDQGHAMAAWQHGDGGQRTLRINRSRVASGWGLASPVEAARDTPPAPLVRTGQPQRKPGQR